MKISYNPSLKTYTRHVILCLRRETAVITGVFLCMYLLLLPLGRARYKLLAHLLYSIALLHGLVFLEDLTQNVLILSYHITVSNNLESMQFFNQYLPNKK